MKLASQFCLVLYDKILPRKPTRDCCTCFASVGFVRGSGSGGGGGGVILIPTTSLRRIRLSEKITHR